MFTSDHRDALRAQLLGLAEKDPRITGAAVTGSAADGRQDRWSDIDLFFGVAEQVALDVVVSDWSDYLYGELAALRHFDLKVPAAVYRAFLLPSCLEVDLGFTPAWQAEYWISGIRDQVLALACLRVGEPAFYAKGADALPVAVTGGLEDALVRSLQPEELRRALRVAATRLLGERHETDAVQAQRLEPPIRELADLPGR